MTSKNLLLLLSMAIALSACHPKPHPDAASAATTTEQNGEGPDVLIPDTERNKVSLRGEIAKHQLTVVDFWASWCGPCKREMPNVVAAYKKYHKKGFEIVGISFDDKKEDWVKAIKEWEMPWIHLSDLKGWYNTAHEVYAVDAIPDNILIDPKGVVVTRDLRGADLEKKLDELFK